MSLRLYAATTSQGKLRDFRTAAAAHALTIEPLPGIDGIAAPEENGLTFADNAKLKAEYYSRFAPGEWVLADDSGLEVDGLHGSPGVRSAALPPMRASWTHPTPTTTPTCGITCCCCSGWHGAAGGDAHGALPLRAGGGAGRRRAAHRRGRGGGLILDAPRGTGGFGYDPLFYLPAQDRTMAEIDLETKLSLSHRGRAIAALLPMLSNNICLICR